MSILIPLLSGYDLLGEHLEQVPPWINPVQSLIGTGFVTAFAHVARIAFTRQYNHIHPRSQARKLEKGLAARVHSLH